MMCLYLIYSEPTETEQNYVELTQLFNISTIQIYTIQQILLETKIFFFSIMFLGQQVITNIIVDILL